MDIEYRYLMEVAGQDAREIRHAYVRFGSNGPRMSFGELLFKLHVAAYQDLKRQEHNCFRGFWRRAQRFHPLVPAYEVRLDKHS